MTVAVYDLSKAPITFDAICFAATVGSIDPRPRFVVLADQRRMRTQKDNELEEWEWRWRAHRVIAASFWLLPGCRGVEVITDARDAVRWRDAETVLRPDPLIRTCVAQHALGHDVRILRAPGDAVGAIEAAGFAGPLAVLQMRAARAQPTKNSNRDAWIKAARYIAGKGCRVVIVPDTDEVFTRFDYPADLDVYAPAALDIGLRCALYERASLVLSAGIGPAHFCMLRSDGRYAVMVRHAKHTLAELKGTYERATGIQWGAQLPFADRKQRIVYRADSFEAITAAFDSIV